MCKKIQTLKFDQEKNRTTFKRSFSGVQAENLIEQVQELGYKKLIQQEIVDDVDRQKFNKLGEKKRGQSGWILKAEVYRRKYGRITVKRDFRSYI